MLVESPREVDLQRALRDSAYPKSNTEHLSRKIMSSLQVFPIAFGRVGTAEFLIVDLCFDYFSCAIAGDTS